MKKSVIALTLAGVFAVPFFAKKVGRKVAFISLFAIAVLTTASFYVLDPLPPWVVKYGVYLPLVSRNQ